MSSEGPSEPEASRLRDDVGTTGRHLRIKLAAFFLSMIIIGAGVTWWESRDDEGGGREENGDRTLSREYQTEEEKAAIMAAEGLNVAEVLGRKRFSPYYGDRTNEYEINRGYVWPNLIDGAAIEFYKARLNYLNGHDYIGNVRLNYSVECKQLAVLSFEPQNITNQLSSYTHVNLRVRASHPFATFDGGEWWALNLTGLAMDGGSYVMEDCFVVRQVLEYDEVDAPLAGYFGDVEQMMVLDEDLTPRVIILWNTHGIS